MVTRLSENSFLLTKKGDVATTLQLNITVDETFKYEIYCTKDRVFGNLIIGNGPEVFHLDPKDPISSIILKDVISHGLVMCRESHYIRIWKNKNLLDKHRADWFGKISRIYDIKLIVISFIFLLTLVFAIVHNDKFFGILAILDFIFLCIRLRNNIIEDKELENSIENIMEESEKASEFVRLSPEIEAMLENAAALIDQQIEKIRNNKIALN